MIEKTILLGFHEKEYLEQQQELFGRREYVVTAFSEPEKMIDNAKQNQYGWYVMDVNFGYSQTENFTFARAIREIISAREQNGEARFFCLSASPFITKTAREQGLPALTKTSFEDLFFENFDALSSEKIRDLLEIIKYSEPS